MLCDGCDEVFCGEPVTCADCAFCSQECFSSWFGGARGQRPESTTSVSRPSRTGSPPGLTLVATTVVGEAIFAPPQPGMVALFEGPGFQQLGYAVARCHARRVMGGECRRVTVPCGRRHVDPRPIPQRA
jgi:hypothetical protein